MPFNTQQIPENGNVLLLPLSDKYYIPLYEIASDHSLWEHYPINIVYTIEGFDAFYQKAVAVGSLVIIDKNEEKVIDCNRFYDYNASESTVVIGHTFIAREYWGNGYNTGIKN